MPENIIERFEVKYLQVVNEKGEADSSLLPPLTDEEIKRIFETIILVRTFNSRSLSLQREGRIGTYASMYGQEASEVGSALALDKDDWVFPTFRETGVSLALGYPIWLMFRYWLGDERGMKCPEGLNIFPMSVPVGSHITHVTGAAWAMLLKGDKNVAVAYFGDGGSSRGDFHEGLNMAGVFKVPAVFICQNNQWAISVPRKSQTAGTTIAQRAWSYGFEGIQVDGNDVFAVYKATKEAVQKAKNGGGPTLIESFTYRLDDHTTADDASRYRSDEEVREWKAKEPLIRLRLFMEKKGLWTEDYEKDVTKKAEELVDKGIEEEESFRPPEPKDIILYTNGELNPRQVKELKEFGWEK
jgi:pyruvate dehydrogenase E1 component alpha subunit